MGQKGAFSSISHRSLEGWWEYGVQALVIYILLTVMMPQQQQWGGRWSGRGDGMCMNCLVLSTHFVSFLCHPSEKGIHFNVVEFG